MCNGDDEILIANIASPNSVANIQSNAKVCVSFIHVSKQKGFKLYGKAHYIPKTSTEFAPLYANIKPLTGDKFAVVGVIRVHVAKVSPIIVPSYALFPHITEREQIAGAKRTYGVK